MITVFKSVTDIKFPYYIPIAEALERIRSGKSKDKVEAVRAEQDREKRNLLKGQLPCVVFSGEFSERTDKALLKHSGYVVLDFDHVPDVDKIKNEVYSEPFVLAVWRSPSGDGVKALARIKFPEKHTDQYLSLEKHFTDKGISSDIKNKNISRVCYESYDPDILIKKDEDVIPYEGVFIPPKPAYVNLHGKMKQTQQVTQQETDDGEIYNKLKLWMSKNGQFFVEGNRNNFIARFAGALNRFGVSENSTCSLLSVDYTSGTFTQSELEKTVKSIFRHYQSQHGSAHFDKTEIINQNNTKPAEEVFDVDMSIKDLIRFQDVYNDMEYRLKNGNERGDTTYFKNLDNHFRFMKKETTLLHGYGNVGKSAVLNQLMMNQSVFNKTRWAIFTPENTPIDYFFQELCELYLGKHLSKFRVNSATESEKEKAKIFVNEHFYVLYPKDDAPTLEYMMKRFAEVIIKYGVRGAVIDPWNQLDHDRGSREDLYLEKMLNKWGRFAQDQDIYAIIVHHPKTPMSNGTTKVYSEPDVFTLSGGAMWNNKMSNILCYHRPNYFVNPMDKWCTVSSQKIKKQKLNGIPGKVNFLYNPDTMRFMELEGEPVTPSDAGYNPLDDINPSDVSFEVKPPIEEDEDEMPF